jgi:hypothetical protein
MNTDSVKTEKDAVDDGKKKKALLMKSEDWRVKTEELLKCWWREKKDSAVDEEAAVNLTVAG